MLLYVVGRFNILRSYWYAAAVKHSNSGGNQSLNELNEFSNVEYNNSDRKKPRVCYW